MGNLAVVNTVGLAPQAYEPVFSGPSALEWVFKWARSIPNYQGMILLADEGAENFPPVSDEEFFRVIRRKHWTESLFIDALAEGVNLAREENPEAFFYAWGDCPLLDGETTAVLWKLHYKYDAEYTFADGYPYGLTPEVFSPQLPEKLKALAVGRDGPVERSSVFEILRQNINAFDVETHLSPKDLRMKRVSISCDTRRNKSIAELLYSAGGTNAEALCRVIPENLKLLRNLPAYFPIQITDHCPQACSYCPFPRFFGNPLNGGNFMEPEKFKELCRRIVEFAGDAVIVPSLWGEPASHPQIGEIIGGALDIADEKRTRVLIETSGIGWDKNLLADLAKEFAGGRLMWIVSLDAADAALYRTLRGEGMAEAEDTARTLAELFHKNCWMQAVRMNENEEDLEAFYQRWKDVGGGAIIQKHDSYGGFLDNLQPADLSPLDRFPCWHLKRDMPILINGQVPICRTDLGRREALGNAFEEDLESIWSRGESLHEAHIRSEFPGPCEKCDEYYTFNF